jgi:hypothetical protein
MAPEGIPGSQTKGSLHMKTAVPATLALTLATRILAASDAAGAPTVSGSGSETKSCTQACLAQVLGEFKSSVLAKKPVKLADDAVVRENMEITTVEQSAWKDVKAIRSTAAFADSVTGNVVSRDGVEINDGKPGYISTRLRVDRGRITEVELSGRRWRQPGLRLEPPGCPDRARPSRRTHEPRGARGARPSLLSESDGPQGRGVRLRRHPVQPLSQR